MLKVQELNLQEAHVLRKLYWEMDHKSSDVMTTLAVVALIFGACADLGVVPSYLAMFFTGGFVTTFAFNLFLDRQIRKVEDRFNQLFDANKVPESPVLPS